ncbi:hypothetical protein TI03_05930, partial [Achromatium sp. WMS1]
MLYLAFTNLPVYGRQLDGLDINIPLDLTRLDAGLTWDYCGSPSNKRPSTLQQSKISLETPINISADNVEFFLETGKVILQGNVVADRGNQHLESDAITYERALGLIHSPGPTLLKQPELRLLGLKTEVNILTHQAKMSQLNYRMIGNNARGRAASAFIENDLHSHYQDITYTTCPRGNNAWLLSADKLDVDRKEGAAIAKNVILNIAGLPVFYTPYLSIPIDDRRKSGFLFPTIGISSRLG